MEREEAREALEDIARVERKLATEGPEYPLWRHAAFAAVMAGLVLSQGLGGAIGTVILVLGLAGIALLTMDDRKRYGVFVSGYRKGKTLPLTLALVATMLGAMGGEIYARVNDLSIGVKLGIAGAAFVVALAVSILWTRIYRRELIGERR